MRRARSTAARWLRCAAVAGRSTFTVVVCRRSLSLGTTRAAAASHPLGDFDGDAAARLDDGGERGVCGRPLRACRQRRLAVRELLVPVHAQHMQQLGVVLAPAGRQRAPDLVVVVLSDDVFDGDGARHGCVAAQRRRRRPQREAAHVPQRHQRRRARATLRHQRLDARQVRLLRRLHLADFSRQRRRVGIGRRRRRRRRR
mmetsp:Transcript_16670/g.58283  ORF Transcript_16670/g.58283 Transcript_16670/m.58283 type:complete len:200 (+) Transcript_16670:531-1130(+)